MDKSNSSKTMVNFLDKRNDDKKMLSEKLTKEQLVEIIFKQNDLISQQSSQMIDLINLLNSVENYAKKECEQKKCSAENRQIKIYNNSFKIQAILFFLFIITFVWLIYYSKSSHKDSI